MAANEGQYFHRRNRSQQEVAENSLNGASDQEILNKMVAKRAIMLRTRK